MKPELARAAIVFLQRAMIHGSEAPMFNQVMQALIAAAEPRSGLAPASEAPRESPNFQS